MISSEGPLLGSRRAIAIVSILAAMALVVLDASIANVALPTIAAALDVSPARSIWIATAYQTALVMVLLTCAALGEALGHRRVFIGGCAVFTMASLFCAVAPTLPWLIAARFLQGLGGAAIMALGIALLRFVVGPARIGAAIGWNAINVALFTAAGPTIGATILSIADWHWMFAVNLPIGALALLAARQLPGVAGTGRLPDMASAGLNALGFAALVLGAELLPTRPLLAAGLFALAAIAIAALVHRERPQVAPLVPLDLLRGPAFRVAIVASVCCFSGQGAGLVALPFYLQHGLGRTALQTGLLMTAWPLTVALVTPLTTRLLDRVPTAMLCAAGGLCMALGLAGCAFWPLGRDLSPLVVCVGLCGLGFGLFQVPNNRTMLLSAPVERSGAAGGMQGTARLTGQTGGAVAMTLIFMLAPMAAAPRIGLAAGALLTLAAGLVSLLRLGAGEPARTR